MPNDWTDKDDKELKRLLKKFRSLSLPDPSHDIKFGANLLEGKEAEQLVEQALLKGEVKRDYKAGETGNIFLEFESRGKPSGLNTSEADYWIFVLSDEQFQDEVFVGIKASRLQRISDSISWETRGGDGNTSKGKLIPLTKLISKRYGA